MPQKADGIQQFEDPTTQTNIATLLALHSVPSQGATTNVRIRDVVGNKTDVANETVDVASLVGLSRAVLADTTGLNGAVMRGTDNAATAVEMAKVPKSDGAVTWNATALGSINAEVVNVVETDNKLNKLIVADDRPAATVYPVSVVAESILAFLMSKSASPDAASFNNTTDSLEALADTIAALNNISTAQVNTEVDNGLNTIVPASPTAGSINDILSKAAGGNTFSKTTDSLEMLSDKAGAFSGDGGAAQDDSVKASLDLAHTDLDSIYAQVTALNSLFLTRRIVKTVAFDGTAGNGAVGTINLFTITGGVDYSLEAFCTETLVDAANLATISVGTASSTAKIIAVTGAAGQGGVTISINEIWHDISPDASTELEPDASKEFTSYGEAIIATIAGEAITDGTLVFSVIYTPRTSGAVMEAA